MISLNKHFRQHWYSAPIFLLLIAGVSYTLIFNTVSNGGTTPAAVAPGWGRVLEDTFDGTTWPSHWSRYNSVYRAHPVSLQIPNCANPRQAWLANGYMTMRMEWKDEICGSSSTSPRVVGWHSAGMSLKGYSNNDQSVTLRWRVVQYPGVDANGNTAKVISHRIIPMRWPDAGLHEDANARYYGEEDFCEGRTNTSCRSFIHYGGKACPDCQIYKQLPTIDVTQWHTMRFEQRNYQIRGYFDNLSTPVWTCDSTTSPACNSTNVMTTLRHAVLQQECNSHNGAAPNATALCPPKSTAKEDIQIDWLTVDNPL